MNTRQAIQDSLAFAYLGNTATASFLTYLCRIDRSPPDPGYIVAMAVQSAKIRAAVNDQPEPISSWLNYCYAPDVEAINKPLKQAHIADFIFDEIFKLDVTGVSVEHVRRETTEKETLYSWTDVSMREGIAKTWTERLPGLPRDVYEELAKIPPAELGAAEEGQLQELRRRLLEKGETPEKAVRAMWVGELTDASSRLRQAVIRGMALPAVPSRSPQDRALRNNKKAGRLAVIAHIAVEDYRIGQIMGRELPPSSYTEPTGINPANWSRDWEKYRRKALMRIKSFDIAGVAKVSETFKAIREAEEDSKRSLDMMSH